MDQLTKYAHLIALPHPFIATIVAEVFFVDVYKLLDTPTTIVNDRGPTFISKF